MKRLFALMVFALTLAPFATYAQDGHEYSPLVEKTVNYKNWTLNDLKENKPVDLRTLAAGKKLVMIVYFAPWCPKLAKRSARWLPNFTRSTRTRDSRLSALANTERATRSALSSRQPARLIQL